MNSKKRCLYCKGHFLVETGIMSNQGFFHNTKCRQDYVYKNTEKVLKKSRQLQKKQFAEDKRAFNSNDIRKQHKLTQTVFNKMRKLQELKWFADKGLEPECISCGKTDMDWCTGHLKTVGSSGSHRYNPENTKLQCNRYCNMGLSGNINGNKTTRGYLQGLTDRFGRVEAKRILDSLTDSVKKWTCEELIEMRKGFNVEIRRLEN